MSARRSAIRQRSSGGRRQFRVVRRSSRVFGRCTPTALAIVGNDPILRQRIGLGGELVDACVGRARLNGERIGDGFEGVDTDVELVDEDGGRPALNRQPRPSSATAATRVWRYASEIPCRPSSTLPTMVAARMCGSRGGLGSAMSIHSALFGQRPHIETGSCTGIPRRYGQRT